MTKTSTTRLLAMINQIVLNMSASGCDDEIAEQVAQHLEKFWSAKLKTAVIEHYIAGQSQLSTIIGKAIHNLHQAQQTKSALDG